MILKVGSKGREVKELQEFLGITADGDFGPGTEKSVKTWQAQNGLTADGIVGPNTWDTMGLASTDNVEQFYTTESGLVINRHYLPKGEYKEGPTSKEYLFLHHTAGWHKPHKCIDSWGRDSRGSIATEFVLGGPSIKGDDFDYDGKMLQAFPEGGYGWHLGKNGSQHMHTHSVGLEICNFGYIKDGKTYAGTTAHSSQIVKLDKPFRGYQEWHRYSNKQIESTRQLILHIAERDNIQVRDGLVKEIKKNGVNAFEFNENAYYGKGKGMWTHTNTRKDKTDLFPQQELIDMLLSL
jgi:hypothetical protein